MSIVQLLQWLHCKQQQRVVYVTITVAWTLPRILSPMARLKFSMRTSVFLISVEKTSLPTIGEKGTWAMVTFHQEISLKDHGFLYFLYIFI